MAAAGTALGCSVGFDLDVAAREGHGGEAGRGGQASAGAAGTPAGGASGAAGATGIGGAAGRGGAMATGGVAGAAGGAGSPAAGAAGANEAGAAGAGGATAGGSSGAGGAGMAGSAGAAGSAGSTGAAKCPGGSAAECDDRNPCTIDQCNAGACSYALILPGSACDLDDDRCTGVGICEGGTCKIVPQSVPVQEDGDPCTEGVCDPSSGAVSHRPRVTPGQSTACVSVTCDAKTGEVVTTDLEDDDDACTIDACDPVMGPSHVAVAVADGDPCTADSCDRVKGVVHTALPGCGGCALDPQCDDANPCTVDACLPNGLCRSEPVVDGTACDNETVCDGREACQAGACVKTSPPIDPNDGNPCTTDGCSPGFGAVHKPVSVDDGNPCTVDSCDPTEPPATAIRHVPVVVGDGDPCTIDACTNTGAITHTPVPTCVSCSKAADCPLTTCQSAACLAQPEGSVCAFGNAAPYTPCEDGAVCNGSEYCDAIGKCRSGPAPFVDDGDTCTVDACVEETGVTHTPTVSCPSCASDAECAVPTDPCFIGACLSGKCGSIPAPKGTPCSDGIRCNGAETCDGGICRAGAPPTCAPASCLNGILYAQYCDEEAAAGCTAVSDNCDLFRLACSEASQACVGCDNALNRCVGDKVCDERGSPPHVCCLPATKTVTCGPRTCGNVVNNCGQSVSCGTCAADATCDGFACVPNGTGGAGGAGGGSGSEDGCRECHAASEPSLRDSLPTTPRSGRMPHPSFFGPDVALQAR